MADQLNWLNDHEDVRRSSLLLRICRGFVSKSRQQKNRKKFARKASLNRLARGPGLMNRHVSRDLCLSQRRRRVRRGPRPTNGAIINISYSLWAAEWQRPLRSSSFSPPSLLVFPFSFFFFFLSCFSSYRCCVSSTWTLHICGAWAHRWSCIMHARRKPNFQPFARLNCSRTGY